MDQVVPLLGRIACALEQIADQSRDTRDSDSPKVSRQTEALVWAITHQVSDNATIAKRFGVTPRTVRRWSDLQKYLNGMKYQESPGEPRTGLYGASGWDGVDDHLPGDE